MDNHDTHISTPDEFDLHRAALYFRRSVSKEFESPMSEISIMDQIQTDGGGDLIQNQRSTEADDISLSEYVEAYNELNKMFPKLGRLFSFIASDVGDKTRILSEYQSSPIGEKYKMIGSMLDYEKNEARILGTDPKDVHHPHHLNHHHHHHDLPNGSRTLLRLHRALLFVVQFIDCIRTASDQDKMSYLARQAYDATLAPYHPWLVRKGVHLAVHTLPNRHQLMTDLAGKDVAMDDAERIMVETVEAGRTVYNIVQKLYERHQLLDLP